MKRGLEAIARRWAAAGICATFGVSLLMVFGAGCARPRLEPTVRVSGAWALYPMMVRWAEEFRHTRPDVRIDVSAGGAGKGAADAIAGRADIGMVSREIHPDEIKQGAFWIPVVKDGVFATVNAANPVVRELAVQGVKREILTALWIEAKAPTWGEVAGNRKIKDRVHVYTRSDPCGAAETWAKYLGKRQQDLKGIAESGDDRLADALKRDPLGIGFSNLAYAYDAKTGKASAGLWVVPIDINGNGKLDESEDFYRTLAEVKRAIATGAYPPPLTRQNYLLTKGKPTGLAREFIYWILHDGQRFVEQSGYIALPQERLEAAIKRLG